jgi:hypothetical protein
VFLLRHTRPAVIDLDPWTQRPDADQLRADRDLIETTSRARETSHP